MKHCNECKESSDWLERCLICGEFICDQCWPKHDKECKVYPKTPKYKYR